MAIQSQLRRSDIYVGDGVQTQFSFSFKLLKSEDAEVHVAPPHGVDAVLNPNAYVCVLNDDQDVNPGGKITLKEPLVKGAALAVISGEAYVQPTVFTNRGAFFPTVLNDSLDRATIMCQQLKEQNDRAVKTAPTDSRTPEQLLSDIFNTEKNAGASAAAAANSAAEAKVSAGTAQKYSDAVTDFKDQIVATGNNIAAVKTNAENIEDIKTAAKNVAAIKTNANNIVSIKVNADNMDAILDVRNERENIVTVAGHLPDIHAIGEEARQSQESAKKSAEAAAASEAAAKVSQDNAFVYRGEAATARNEAQKIAEGVTALDGSGVAQATLDLMKHLGASEVDTDEYLRAFVDAEGRLLWWVDHDGNIGWSKGIPEPIQKVLTALQELTAADHEALSTAVEPDNPEWLKVWQDKEGKVLAGIRADGTFEFFKGIPVPVQAALDALTTADEGHDGRITKLEKHNQDIEERLSTKTADNPEWLKLWQDKEGKVLAGIRTDGYFAIPKIGWSDKSLSDLEQLLTVRGFKTPVPIDWSDAASLQIPEPRCAVVNIISDENSMPASKTADQKDWMEFWDMRGNYFKKRIINNAQGDTSLIFLKKNFGFDLCNDEWKGDDTFSIRFGDWVPQDSFHAKAYYTDYFRGVAVVSYQLMNEVCLSRGVNADRPWKIGLGFPAQWGEVPESFADKKNNEQELDTGARCFPDGFPVIVYFNGKFYGIFSWQLKKSKENMHMDKSTAEHIHLDGIIDKETLFNVSGNDDFSIQWDKFEIRNPKGLTCVDGTKYKSDTNQKELIDSSSALFDPGNENHIRSAKVKEYIQALSLSMYNIKKIRSEFYSGKHSQEGAEKVRARFVEYFYPENWIDYLCVSDIIRNDDGFRKNWQWATYDGKKWFINIYDVDQSFGGFYLGDRIQPPLKKHINADKDMPQGIIHEFYSSAGDFGTGALEDRYAQLRRAKIFDTEHIVNLVRDWTLRIGVSNFNAEFKKWDKCPCHGTPSVNSVSWRLVTDESGAAVKADSATYNDETTYLAGQRVSYGVSEEMGYYVFEAISETTGTPPIASFKYFDSIYRIKNWIDAEIKNMDLLYNFTESRNV